jgi:hypothetical protein
MIQSGETILVTVKSLRVVFLKSAANYEFIVELFHAS